MILRKNESEIDGWKSIEIKEFDEKDIEKVDMNDLGWYLITRGVNNIFWKDGYHAYFNSGSMTETDIKNKTIVSYFFINNVLYLKGKYHKYVEIDNETLETKFIDNPKLNTTEKTYVVVFKFKSQNMGMILEQIKKFEKD